jgi:hypothetical protein
MGCGGKDILLLPLAVDVGEWSASRPCHFTPGTRSIGGWVGPRAGLDPVKGDVYPTGCGVLISRVS